MKNFINQIIKKNLFIIVVFTFTLSLLAFSNGVVHAQDMDKYGNPVANPTFQPLPVVVEAPPNYVYQGSAGIQGLFSWFGTILGMVLPLIVAVSVVWFVFSVFQYTIYDTEKDKAEVRQQLIWGIVGLFVMVSVWGLVSVLRSTFNLNNTTINAPVIKLNN